MSPTNILEKRRRTLEQQRNRLKQMENSVSVLARKQRTRRLIELGGLVAKAQLETWPVNALLGAFLSLKESENNRYQKETWTFKGRFHFIAGKKGKVPLTVTFRSFPNRELCDTLKALGFTWNIHEYR